MTASVCRLESVHLKVQQLLQGMVQRAFGGIQGTGLLLGRASIKSSGLVQGFFAFMEAQGPQFREAARNAWTRACEAGLLSTEYESCTHSLQDIVSFFAYWPKLRKRARQKPLQGRVAEVANNLSMKVVRSLADLLEQYLCQVYIPSHDVAVAPPVLRKHGSTMVKAPPLKIWCLLQKAHEKRCSVRQAINLDSSGISESAGYLWVAKYLEMYADKARWGFFDTTEAPHVSIVADPATHSTKEICVTLAYAWQNDLAACCPVQWILPTAKASSGRANRFSG
jgi:hypothetical protein